MPRPALMAALFAAALTLSGLSGCAPAGPAQSSGNAPAAGGQAGGEGAQSRQVEVEQAEEATDWGYESQRLVSQGDSSGPFVTGLRVGVHRTYDRIVLDLSGVGPLGWRAAYTDEPRSQGKGDPVDVPGAAFLSVDVTGVSIPTTDEDYEVYFDDPTPVHGSILQAAYLSTFEGVAQVVIGVDAERPFRIFTLEDPLRVVIDVSNE